MVLNKFLNLPNGSKMPIVGLGTWQAKDESELKQALETALEIGYRHIDTAYAYENEKVIGEVLKKWFDSGKLKREDIFITTKLPSQGVHPDRVDFFIKKSLEDLQLDYIDLYLVHCALAFKCDETTGKTKLNEQNYVELEPKTDHVGVWKKMEEQVEAGRTKSIGLSNYNISQIETVLKTAKIKPANLQVELHVYLQQRALVDFCHKNGITLVAYAPLGSPGYNKFLKSFTNQERVLPNILGDPVVNKIAAKHSKTPAQIVLRFLLQREIAVIPKSVSPKRVKENFDVFDFTLDDSDFKALWDLETGETARVCNFRLVPGIENHPDFPFKN